MRRQTPPPHFRCDLTPSQPAEIQCRRLKTGLLILLGLVGAAHRQAISTGYRQVKFRHRVRAYPTRWLASAPRCCDFYPCGHGHGISCRRGRSADSPPGRRRIRNFCTECHAPEKVWCPGPVGPDRVNSSSRSAAPRLDPAIAVTSSRSVFTFSLPYRARKRHNRRLRGNRIQYVLITPRTRTFRTHVCGRRFALRLCEHGQQREAAARESQSRIMPGGLPPTGTDAGAKALINVIKVQRAQ